MSSHVSRYANFFQELSEDTLFEEYKKFFDENSYFEDPFQKVKGIDKIYHIFEDMYASFYNPRFKVLEAVGDDDVSYIRWEFYYELKMSSEEDSFVGISRVSFNEHGMIKEHIDYWDAGANVYEKIPLLGSVIRLIKRKIHA